MSKNEALKNTIHLPKTSFKMKANLPHKEPETIAWWDRIDAYGKVAEARADAAPWVLHDGPPYANGHIHLGQALNKILKDFVVKSRSMMGHDARYVPGWDCHGLPIEHRVDKDLGPKKRTLSALEVRARCRAYAEKFIGIQKDEFRRLGVFWDRALDAREEAEGAPSRKAIYRTLDRTYEAEIVRVLGRFFTEGSIYQGEKPVHWCYSCRTALAEAEVEYADRADPSVYVAFPVHGAGARVPELEGRDVAAVVWTTTPWTLPANLAVALHPELEYVGVDYDSVVYLVAAGLEESVRERLAWGEAPVVARFSGSTLVGAGDDWAGASLNYDKPYAASDGPASGPGVFLLGEHVTLDAGTGLVHTAPGHGADDFVVGRAYDLAPFNPVGDDGRFIEGVVPHAAFAGKHVLEANPEIVEDLKQRGLLLSHASYPHSYPHCWRCKNPVLFRSTPQWFIEMEAGDLRTKSVAEIRGATWLPAFGEDRIAKMVETRPDWCISRQRTWGVPIPAVTCGDCFDGKRKGLVVEPRLFDHLERLFLEEGSDAWFGVPDGDRHRPYADDGERRRRLVPDDVSCPECGSRQALELHDHIVDVWFESGVSHSAVLGRDPKLPWPADLYLEGHDQYRGWFHSSLLAAVGDRGSAPYRGVVTHGFTLDADGKKMSKSLGNVISPLDVAKKRGAEILRLWVSMVDFLEDMRLSEETLDRNAEAYRKVRNTFRYLLGNLNGFDHATDSVPVDDMLEIDRWILAELDALRERLLRAYEGYEYHVVYHELHRFAGSTLSSFYLDVIKDRLYTAPERSRERRSAQTALHRLAVDLCRLMAPVLCFTAEEIWQHLESLAGREAWDGATVHAETFPAPLAVPEGEAVRVRWARLLELREDVSKALETSRAEKEIGGSLEAEVAIEADDETRKFLEGFGDDLRFLFLTSGVSLVAPGDMPTDRLRVHASDRQPGLRVGVARAPGEKCDRCWHLTEDVGADPAWPGACARCVRSIAEAAAAR